MSAEKPMKLRLTLSGLCVIVLHSQEDYPKNPDAVEILCVGAHGHTPRLSYWPEDRSSGTLDAALQVDPGARKSVALEIKNQVVTLDVRRNSDPKFNLGWGENPDARKPHNTAAERQMNWVPRTGDLGIEELNRAADPKSLPAGTAARLILPPGDLYAANMVKDRETGKYSLWKFKGDKIRALANTVIYEATDLTYAQLHCQSGAREESVSFEWVDGRTVEIGLSNDMEKIGSGYTGRQKNLDHLKHLEALSDQRTQIFIPELCEGPDDGLRTGHPICPLTLHVHKS